MPVRLGAGSLEGATSLLHDFQAFFHNFNDGSSDYLTHVEDLKLQKFAHGDDQLQGIVATKLIKYGDPVFTAPMPLTVGYPDGQETVPGFEHLKDEHEQLAFWLAQKKVDLIDKLPAGETLVGDDVAIANYIKTLPTLREYKAQGLPLASPYQDLQKLAGLPKLGDLVKSVDEQRESLLDSWYDYSRARGTDSKFGYTDALWGLATVRNRGFKFPNVKGIHMLPVGDMSNFAGKDANTVVGVEDDDDMVSVYATKDIKVGDEITQNYSNGHLSPGLDVLAKHGFFTDDSKETWSLEECAQIQKALPTSVRTSGKMLEAVGKLADQRCGLAVKATGADHPVAETASIPKAQHEKHASAVADEDEDGEAVEVDEDGEAVDADVESDGDVEQMMPGDADEDDEPVVSHEAADDAKQAAAIDPKSLWQNKAAAAKKVAVDPKSLLAGKMAVDAKLLAGGKTSTDDDVKAVVDSSAPAVQMMHPLLAAALPFMKHSVSCRSRAPRYADFL